MSASVLASKSEQDQLTNDMRVVREEEHNDELSIGMKWSHGHTSPMSEGAKEQARLNGPSLRELFDETLQGKGDGMSIKQQWTDEQTVEVEGLSQMTLHSFILQAEKLGKTVQYTKTLTVKISD